LTSTQYYTGAFLPLEEEKNLSRLKVCNHFSSIQHQCFIIHTASRFVWVVSHIYIIMLTLYYAMAITHRRNIFNIMFGIFSLPIIRATTSDSNATLNFILFQSLGIIQFEHKKYGHKIRSRTLATIKSTKTENYTRNARTTKHT